MESSYKRVGDYIQQVDVRNSDSSVTELIGVSISKTFMESVANTIGTDLSKYKVISKGQFACSLMQVSRDGGIAISLYKENTPAIMSPAYYIFEVSSKELLAEYLELVVYNPMFDREAVFNAIGGVRGTLSWEEFCDMKINLPSIEEQQKIVRQYKTIADRIGVLEKLNEKLMDLANIHYLNYIEANEFQEIDIPSLAYLSAGGDTPDDKVDLCDKEHPIPVYSNGTSDDGLFGYTRRAKIKEPSITISARGYIGYTVLHTEPYTPVVRLISVTPKDRRYLEYLYFYFRNLNYADNGSAQQQATIPSFKTLNCLFLNDEQLTEFNGVMEPFFYEVSSNKKQIKELKDLCSVLLKKYL